MSHTILYLIIGILIFEYIFQQTLNFINRNNWQEDVPKEFEDTYDSEKYNQAQKYDKANDQLSFYSSTISTALMIILLITGFLGKFHDYIIQNWTSNPYYSALLFFGLLMLANSIISLPLSLIKTFIIEQRYGFNKMSVGLFFLDLIKGGALGAVIGSVLISLFIWFYTRFPDEFWIYAWIGFSLFGIIMSMFYTDLIVPIFNKLRPLEEGSLKNKIEAFALKVNFPLTNISIIDGSTRSSKANAYFSGFGKKKKIVLFDTLLKDQSEEELVAILAHEIGHYKKKHVLWSFIISSLNMLFILYLLSLFIHSNALSIALGGTESTFALNLLAFSLLYSPISIITSIFMNLFSRKNEFEADAFAKQYDQAEHLITALKKLSVNNLSNLTPHPLYSFIHYSHPPLLERIAAIKKG